jgi:hypothetical protein
MRGATQVQEPSKQCFADWCKVFLCLLIWQYCSSPSLFSRRKHKAQLQSPEPVGEILNCMYTDNPNPKDFYSCATHTIHLATTHKSLGHHGGEGSLPMQTTGGIRSPLPLEQKHIHEVDCQTTTCWHRRSTDTQFCKCLVAQMLQAAALCQTATIQDTQVWECLVAQMLQAAVLCHTATTVCAAGAAPHVVQLEHRCMAAVVHGLHSAQRQRAGSQQKANTAGCMPMMVQD